MLLLSVPGRIPLDNHRVHVSGAHVPRTPPQLEYDIKGADNVEMTPGFPFKQNSLTADLSRLIFTRADVPALLLARGVCRDWRSWLDAAEQRSFWTRLDLSTVIKAARKIALLKAACSRAAGELTSLNISGWSIHADALLDAVGENVANVCDLNVCSTNESGVFAASQIGLSQIHNIDFLLAHFPRLQERSSALKADVYFEETYRRSRIDRAVPKLMRLLRRQYPFSALCLRELYLVADPNERGPDGRYVLYEFDMASINQALRSMPNFSRMVLTSGYRIDGGRLNTLLAGLHLEMLDLSLSIEELPAVTAQLPFLKDLRIYGNEEDPLFDGEEAKEFADSLRQSSIVNLTLLGTCIWDSFAAGANIITACTGLRTLKTLDLSHSHGEKSKSSGPAKGAAWLARMLKHPDCALETLHLQHTRYGFEGAHHIFDALKVNTSMRCVIIDSIECEEYEQLVASAQSANKKLRVYADERAASRDNP
jgi:hypothetical protein